MNLVGGRVDGAMVLRGQMFDGGAQADVEICPIDLFIIRYRGRVSEDVPAVGADTGRVLDDSLMNQLPVATGSVIALLLAHGARGSSIPAAHTCTHAGGYRCGRPRGNQHAQPKKLVSSSRVNLFFRLFSFLQLDFDDATWSQKKNNKRRLQSDAAASARA